MRALACRSMAGRVAVVTDSTARIPMARAAELGITVVPVEVIRNGLPFSEDVDISTAAIAAALHEGDDLSTSRPAPARFVEAYRALAATGASHIVSAHLSADLSGTFHSAQLAAGQVGIPVEVLDSRAISMVLGYAVMEGALAAQRGGDAAEVVGAVRARAAAGRVFFYVDTLEFLRRGGRIGAAAALLGSALRMKPILTVSAGSVQPLEKARTTAKALARIVDLAADVSPDVPVDICVQDVDTPQRAEDLAAELAGRLPMAEVSRGSLGAVLSTHVGPGAIAVVVSPRLR